MNIVGNYVQYFFLKLFYSVGLLMSNYSLLKYGVIITNCQKRQNTQTLKLYG